MSLCMIVRNEEKVIERCLSSVADIVDEIIIVDTGSTDATKEICAKFTDKIFDFEWIDDFAAARNASFSHATKDYIFWLDADDIMKPEDTAMLCELKKVLTPEMDAINMIYCLDEDEYGRPTSTLYRIRLVKREKNFQWHGFIHEYLDIVGNIVNTNIQVWHKSIKAPSSRNLDIFTKHIENGATLAPRDFLYYANELLANKHFEKAALYYESFLDMKLPWNDDYITTYGKLTDIYCHLGDKEKETYYAFKPLEFMVPIAEQCCRIGYSFAEKGQWATAVFWYKMATEVKKPEITSLVFLNGCWTWLPHYQLAICFFNLNDKTNATIHSNIAYEYCPNDPRILEVKKAVDEMK